MRLKRLTLSGFKSFPKRTSIVFSHGVSAIVGPNGSGKSNIVDAIRWVLGERNPRLLRAKGMDDLIFRGNGSKSVGSAYVRLIFENSGIMAPPELESVPEIEIERTLFPDGDAKFRLNRKNCRLKEIQYLFLDTGAGARAYSIIDQGQVGQFVSMSPEQRRVMVEEVAGISRYKARRIEASGRMRQTLQNLERLGDIMLEVEKQAKYLKRQAATAKRYLDLSKKEEELSIFILKSGWDKIISLEKDLMETAARQKSGKADRELKLSVADTKIGETDLLIEENRQQIKALKEEAARIKTGIEGKGLELMDREKQLALCRQTRNSLQEKRHDCAARLTADGKRLEGLKKTTETLISSAASKVRKKTKIHARLKRIDRDYAGAGEELETSKGLLVDLASEKAVLESRNNSFQDSIITIKNRMKRLERQENDAVVELDRLHVKKKDVDRNLQENATKIQCGEQRISEMKLECRGIEDRLSELREQEQKYLSGLSGLQAELDTLERIQVEKGGVSGEVRHILQSLGMNASSLADFLRVEREWEDIVETALGDSIHALILENSAGIQELADRIKTKADAAGRVSLLCMEYLPENQFLPRKQSISSRIPKDFSALSIRITGENRATKVAEYILSNWFFSPDIESALIFKKAQPTLQSIYIITGDGFVITPWNEINFAGSADTKGNGLLWTRARIEDISTAIQDLKDAYATLQETAGQAREQRTLVFSEISRLKKGLVQLKKARDILVSEKQDIKHRTDRTRDRMELHDFEKDEIRSELHDLERQLAETNEKLSHVAKKESEAAERLKKLEKSFMKTRQEKEKIQTLLQHVSVEKAKIDTEVDGIHKEIARLEANTGKLRRLAEDLRKRIVTLSEKEDSLVRQMKELSKDKKELLDLEGGLLRKLQKKEDSLEALNAKRVAWEGRKREALFKLTEATAGLHETELELSRALKEKEYIEETCLSRFRKGIEEIYKLPSPAGDISEAEARDELATTQERIQKIGSVNLTAIEEFDALEKRRSFLREQEEDLRNSVKDIRKAIDRIDRQCRYKLSKAMKDINGSLEKVFPLLFDGGSARLCKKNSANTLEAGVEFIMELPGKGIKNLNLLSGGEKAMSALALIFSIFFIKPSPFCLLDEVDAPLDDTNTGRFNRLVRKISAKSQVIIITHNQKVMETADTLYGVTMEEKGISKLVSVSLM